MIKTVYNDQLPSVIILFIFIMQFAGCTSINKRPVRDEIDFTRATIRQLQDGILSGALTCEQIVKNSFKRIKEHDLSTLAKAPLNAIVTINPFSLQIAQELDRYVKTHGMLVGPLHCVTVAVKDNIDTYDMPTSSGSLALLRSQPNFDAPVVKKMRDAGAVIFVKTTMDELASGMIGQSSLSGRTSNVFNPILNAGGSSGGSAVAVAAGFAQVALGTDNSGSVRIPAAFNGIFGLRPERGALDNAGVFPRGALDGEIGPMARNAEDLRIVYNVIKASSASSKDATLVKPLSLAGVTFGIVQGIANQQVYKHTSAKAKARYQEFLERLKQKGAILKDISFSRFNIDRANNMAGEVTDINEYLSLFPAARKNYREICESQRQEAFPSVKKCLNHLASNSQKNSSEYNQVFKTFERNKALVDQKMLALGVDFLLSPITYNGEVTYDPYQVITWQLPLSSNSGLASLAFVFGKSEGDMPVFMEVLGKPGEEEKLFSLGKAIQDISNTPTVDIELMQPNDKLLNNFDVANMNNLFISIGWKAYSLRHKLLEIGRIEPSWFSNVVKETIFQYEKNMGINNKSNQHFIRH